MARNAARVHPEEMSTPESGEDPKKLRRRKLAEVLSHQGKIELDLDPERLAEFRSAR